jgi:acetyltransferase-like isoleucine patch superfamily enzyme/acyl carrier protein
MTTLYLCGAGNKEGIRLAITVNRKESRWERIVILDDDPALKGTTILGLTIEGPFSLLGQADGPVEVVNLVTRTTKGRWGARQKIASFGHPFASLVHPNIDTFGVTLPDQDITVYEYAALSACSSLGEGCVVFNGAVTGHGSTIGRGCVLAPGAVINARVTMADFSYIGANATIMPDLEIGEYAVIAAASAVIESVPAHMTVMGVPAQPLGVASNKLTSSQNQSIEPDEGIIAQISTVWQDLLDISVVQPDTNFFDQGGNSVLAGHMIRRLQEELDCQLSMIDIFRFPSVNALAIYITNQNGMSGSTDALDRAAKRREHQRRGRRTSVN